MSPRFPILFLQGMTDSVKIMEPEKCEEWQWVTLDDVCGFYEAYDSAEKEGTIDAFQGRRLFIPILNLFRQRGDLLESLVSGLW